MFQTASPEIRVGLVGVSGFAESHLASLLNEEAYGRLKLTCVTIINADEVVDICRDLRERGRRIYDDFGAMLDAEQGQLDLCVIPTGINLHSRMTIAALQAGCHVLVEKPAAGTSKEVDAMIVARDEAKRQVFVGFQNLYQDSTEQVKARILAGEIGCVENIRIMACWPRPVEYYQRNNWAGRLQVNGDWVYDSPANNALAHFLMDALYMSGKEIHRAADIVGFEANLFRVQPIETFDTISANIKTADGIRILYNVTHSCVDVVEPIMEVHGSKGSIRWESRQRITIHPSGEVIPILNSAEARSAMYRRILDSISNGGSSNPGSLEVARTHTHFINQLHARCSSETIPDDWVLTTKNLEGTTQRSIPGIESAIKASFKENRLMNIKDVAEIKRRESP